MTQHTVAALRDAPEEPLHVGIARVGRSQCGRFHRSPDPIFDYLPLDHDAAGMLREPQPHRAGWAASLIAVTR